MPIDKETLTSESGERKEMRVYMKTSVEEFENAGVEAKRLDVDLNEWPLIYRNLVKPSNIQL